MQRRPYQQAFDRLRAEYSDMPGVRLTLEQVERLCGVDRSICQDVLEDLRRAGFLGLHSDGRYARRDSETGLPSERDDRGDALRHSSHRTGAMPRQTVDSSRASRPLDREHHRSL